MRRSQLALVGLLAGVGLAAAGCGGGGSPSSAPPPATATTASSGGGSVLDGTVGPGFDISLKQGGQPVTTLAPGTYVLDVDDRASSHDFHLTGPGVDVSTAVDFVGKKSFTITLTAGTYHFQCDPHSSSMNGDFTVS